MGSALQSFINPQSLRFSDAALSHCEIPLGGVVRDSHAHLYLRTALERSLLSDPHPTTSLLSEVQDARSPVIARFEHGDGSLEQRLESGTRNPGGLPLPFLWSVRVVNEAAAALDHHHQLGISSAVELSPRGIITLQGSTRLNAAILEPRAKLPNLREPHRLSLAMTLASCLGANAPRRLGLTRPLLPASVIQFVDGAAARARHDSTWQSERRMLKQQQRRLQGPHFSNGVPLQYSPRELCSHQLSLLPVLFRLEGRAAVESFFVQARGEALEFEELRAALDLWRRERTLLPGSPLSRSATLERAKIDEDVASRARVAQARFEFERRDARAALLLAIDAVQATPDSPEAWLLLAEIRSSTCSGSQALCLSEAICASRGAADVIEQVLRQLGMHDPRRLAAYFRVHGDHVLADFLEPPPRWQAPSQLQH